MSEITEQELIDALLTEFPPLADYDPNTQVNKEAAGALWNIDPRSALSRLNKMVAQGKLKKLKVRNPETNHAMDVFSKVE